MNIEKARLNDEISFVDKLNSKYLTFWTDNQLYGVSIAHVEQILGVQEITSIPDAPYYEKGIINIRGAVIPVIDMRLRLGKDEVPYNERTCIVIVNTNDMNTGIIVDSVNEVADIDDDDNIMPLTGSADEGNGYTRGVVELNSKLVLIINLNKILGD